MHPVAEERRLCRLDIFRADAAAVDHDTDAHPPASRSWSTGWPAGPTLAGCTGWRRRAAGVRTRGELTDHLGYDCHGPAERDSGDSRDGHRSETVLTDVGAVQVD